MMTMLPRVAIGTDTLPVYTIELMGHRRQKFALRSDAADEKHRTLLLAFHQREGAAAMAMHMRQYHARTGSWPDFTLCGNSQLRLPPKAPLHGNRHTVPRLQVQEESKPVLQTACALNGIALVLVESVQHDMETIRVQVNESKAPLDSVQRHLRTLMPSD